MISRVDWAISLRTTALLEMNLLSHFSRPIPSLVFRKRRDVRYLKDFGAFLPSSFSRFSQPILQPLCILLFLSCRLLAQHMRLMGVSFRLSNQSIGQKHAMSLR